MKEISGLCILTILSFLDSKSLCINFAQVCKEFYEYTLSKRLWYEKILNDFPFEELYQEFDINKDWKSLYITYNNPVKGEFMNNGVFLYGFRVETPIRKYNYHLKQEIYNSKGKDIMIYGGRRLDNAIFGFKRGDVFVFTQDFGKLCGGGICKRKNDTYYYGAFYFQTSDIGTFISFDITNKKTDDHLEEYQNYLKESFYEKKEYNFSDGSYKSTILWDPSKKELKNIELEIKIEYNDKIGYIVLGNEKNEGNLICGIIHLDICSLLVYGETSKYQIVLFLNQKKDEKSIKGFWYKIPLDGFEPLDTIENWADFQLSDFQNPVTFEEFPEKIPFICYKK